MARRAINQGQQQQPGLREAPQQANQSTQRQRPQVNAQTNAVYRPGPTSGARPGSGSAAVTPTQAGIQTAAFRPVTRPGGISGAPTGVTMENAGDKLSEWADRGYTGSVALPADPADLPTEPENLGTTDLPDQPEKSNEEMINDLVRQYLEQAGNVDTTEQEALIEQRIKEQLNMDLMNQRASAGASGFEASGSLIGMEGDIRRQAGTDAVEQILGARTQAERDAFERATGAAEMNMNERKQAYEEWKAKEQLDALNRWLESQGADPVSEGGGGGGGGGDVIDNFLDPDGNGTPQVPGFNDAPGYDGELANSEGLNEGTVDRLGSEATEANSAPDTYMRTETYVDDNGDVWNLYETENGWVKVRAEGATTLGN
jgi:hypothetical protein